MFRLIEHESWVLSISFEKEGKNMASSSWKGDVIIWDMTTISPKVQLNGHSEGILLSFTVLITLITVGGIHKMSLVYISVVKL